MSAQPALEKRVFGWTRREVPVVGQGTWNLDSAGRASAMQTLRRGLDLGLTHIDTAEMYGSGAAEQLVGEAIAGRRGEVFLVSKVLPYNASRTGTVAACEKSLKRLRTDRLDCYLLHWRGQYRLEDTVAAFEQLQRDGKILAWGVSNFDVSDLEEIAAISDGMACNQVLYHIQERAIEHAVIPWCERHGVAVVAYSPYGQGDFPAPKSAGWRVLAEIGTVHAATPRQVALRFLLQSPRAFTIPKASTVEHVTENSGAASFDLSSAEIARINAVLPRDPRRRGLPML